MPKPKPSATEKIPIATQLPATDSAAMPMPSPARPATSSHFGSTREASAPATARVTAPTAPFVLSTTADTAAETPSVPIWLTAQLLVVSTHSRVAVIAAETTQYWVVRTASRKRQ